MVGNVSNLFEKHLLGLGFPVSHVLIKLMRLLADDICANPYGTDPPGKPSFDVQDQRFTDPPAPIAVQYDQAGDLSMEPCSEACIHNGIHATDNHSIQFFDEYLACAGFVWL